jgi:hypothetical protein
MALTALPPEQRSVIELAFFAGPTDDQIAAVNSVPLGTIKGRARLGLRRLPATRRIPAAITRNAAYSNAIGLNDPAGAGTPYDRATLIAHDS